MSDNCEEYFLIKIENVDSICVGYEDNLEKDDWYIDKLVDVKESK